MTRTQKKGVLNIPNGNGTSEKLMTTRSSSNDRKSKSKDDNIQANKFQFLSNDAEGKHPCKGCDDLVTETCDAVQCDRCTAWIHFKCTNLTKYQYDFLAINPKSNIKWFCESCTKEVGEDPNKPDDRLAIQGAKIDTLLKVINSMQNHMISMQEQISSMEERMIENEEDKEKHNIGNQMMQASVAEVLDDKAEIAEKKNNMIMYRVPEAEESNEEKEAEDDVSIVKDILSIVHPNIEAVSLNINNITRMGKNRRNGYARPIKVQFKEEDSKGKVFRNSAKLKSHEKYKNINVSNDKTRKEIEADKALKRDLDIQREDRPQDDLIIYRGEIIPRAERAAKVAARKGGHTQA